MQYGLNVPAHVAIDAVHTAETKAAEYRARAIRFANLVIGMASVELDISVPTGSGYDALGDVFETLMKEENRNSEEQGLVEEALVARQEFRNSGHFAPGDLKAEEWDLRDEVELVLTVNMTHTYTGEVTITVERAAYDKYLSNGDMDALLDDHADEIHEQMMDNSDYECDWSVENIEEN